MTVTSLFRLTSRGRGIFVFRGVIFANKVSFPSDISLAFGDSAGLCGTGVSPGASPMVFSALALSYDALLIPETSLSVVEICGRGGVRVRSDCPSMLSLKVSFAVSAIGVRLPSESDLALSGLTGD